METKRENIRQYNKYKIICELTKFKSLNSIKIVENKDDNWFLYVLTYRTKTGDIYDSNMIIKPDIDTWINHFKRSGWDVKK